ncbi:hypothetical protein GCM10007298_26600 [Williamsia phyllosphaerae]|uniref:Uncharacterized protein n=1 Tax=Williamsia phyllosphaerae TaxID=885042 RepID=A0ABQ1UXU7_9NOCA|nr:hypothetical protein GCM10007298_26600 [Williamsia phyllosphaerae]
MLGDHRADPPGGQVETLGHLRHIENGFVGGQEVIGHRQGNHSDDTTEHRGRRNGSDPVVGGGRPHSLP